MNKHLFELHYVTGDYIRYHLRNYKMTPNYSLYIVPIEVGVLYPVKNLVDKVYVIKDDKLYGIYLNDSWFKTLKKDISDKYTIDRIVATKIPKKYYNAVINGLAKVNVNNELTIENGLIRYTPEKELFNAEVPFYFNLEYKDSEQLFPIINLCTAEKGVLGNYQKLFKYKELPVMNPYINSYKKSFDMEENFEIVEL